MQNPKPKTIHHLAAFTLFEVLLTVALIAMTASFSFSSYQGLIASNDVQTAMNAVVKAMRTAQLNSQAVLKGDSWGVKVDAGGVTVFKGSSYAARDTAEDVILPLSANVAVGGTTEYVFARFTGLVTAGSVTLSALGNSKQISINAKGTLTY